MDIIKYYKIIVSTIVSVVSGVLLVFAMNKGQPFPIIAMILWMMILFGSQSLTLAYGWDWDYIHEGLIVLGFIGFVAFLMGYRYQLTIGTSIIGALFGIGFINKKYFK